MRNGYLRFAIVAAILTACLLFSFFRDSFIRPTQNEKLNPQSTNVKKHIYTDSQYGFTFEYLNNLVVEETTTEIIVKKDGSRYAEFYFPERYIGQPGTPLLDFEEYATYFAKAMCDASGAGGNVYCDKVENSSVIENASGLTIRKLSLHEVTENYFRSEISERVREPIYAINTDGRMGETKLILLIPNEDNKDKDQISTLEDILKSITF